ncbi:unnamed protein product [Prorocentrum cordatum]|uniref:Uncharacterized protein n=1 Tax=Prorocentrum cordatum TaxID=2364126 RepID=A0ABN9VW96_9DINO|nr:unnamed protein product [Polarella glacialis]
MSRTLAEQAQKLASDLQAFAGALQSLPSHGRPGAVVDGIRSLRTALSGLWDAPEIRGRKPLPRTAARARKRGFLVGRLRQKVRKVEGVLKKERASRAANRIDNLWFARVAVAKPTVPAATVAAWCRDFSAEQSNQIGTTTISACRGAFAEAVKWLNKEEITRAAAGSHDPVAILHHVHDEAAMRMKSVSEEPDAQYRLESGVVRSRSSKIQGHALDVQVGTSGPSIEVYTELGPMLRKDAPTVATTLIARALDVIALLQRARCPCNMLVFVCSSHAANLAVQAGICGKIMPRPVQTDRLLGTASRMFKYVVPDYQAEFHRNLRHHIADDLEVVPRAAPPAPHPRSAALQALYGKQALPDDLVRFFDSGLQVFKHSGVGADERAAHERACNILSRTLLRVDDRPTVTWRLLKLPAKLLHAGSVKPSKQNAKRLNAVLKYLTDDAEDKHLRKVCLCLRLSLPAVSLTARKAPSEKDEDQGPVLVQLGKGVVQRRTAWELRSVLQALHADPCLDKTDCACALLTTWLHIRARFHQYSQYPARLWALTPLYNRQGRACNVCAGPARGGRYSDAIAHFLTCDESELDVGYSVPLRRRALRERSIAGAMAFMLQRVLDDLPGAGGALARSPPRRRRPEVQEELRAILAAASTNSLEAERRHKQRTKGEQREIVHQGDSEALRAYQAEHEGRLRAEAKAMREAAKVKDVSEPMPWDVPEWAAWMGRNEEMWKDWLRTATADWRSFNAKIVPLGDLPPAPRLQPLPAPDRSEGASWHRKLLLSEAGFYSIGHRGAEGRKVFVFACSLLSTCWAIVLRPVSRRRVRLDLDGLERLSAPVQDALQANGVKESHDLRLVRLEVHVDEVTPSGVVFGVNHGYEVADDVLDRAPKARAEPAGPEDDEDHVSIPDSDLQSVADSLEQEAMDDVEEATDEEEAGEEPPPSSDSEEGPPARAMGRAAPGTYVVDKSLYFSISNNPAWPDVKVKVNPRWRGAAGMGTKSLSKTVTCHHFGEDKATGDIPVSLLVLRAWTIHRMERAGFHLAEAHRQQWVARQKHELRAGLAALEHPSGGAGSPRADKHIRKWAGLLI